jgi:hypothetical protein
MTSERQRRIAQRLAAERKRQGRRRRLSWLAAAVFLVVLASAATVAVLHRPDQAAAGGTAEPGPQPTASGGTGELGPEGIPLQTGAPLASIAGAASGETVDGIRCEVSEQVAYHIHAHLAVFVNGAPRSIPYGIGVVTPAVTQTAQGPFAQATRCYYWLHTHASDGILHVESPTQRQYTLGNFFDIWRQPLSGQQVGPATGTVTAYVNGVRYTGDPRGIVLTEHSDIQLDMGTPIVSPAPVDWSTSQL